MAQTAEVASLCGFAMYVISTVRPSVFLAVGLLPFFVKKS